MMQPHRPEHNNKCNTKYWGYKLRKGFQTLDTIFVSFLHSFVFIELLQSLLLLLLIDIDQLMMPIDGKTMHHRGKTDPRVGLFCHLNFMKEKNRLSSKFWTR